MSDSGLAQALIAAGSALLGTIIGGGITYYSQRAQRAADRRDERIAVARGVSAELRAYIDLVTERYKQAPWPTVLANLRGGKDVPLSGLVPPGRPIEQLFPVFFSQLDKVGLLGEAVPLLGRFFTQLGGIISTLEMCASGRFDRTDLSTRVDVVEQEMTLWEDTVRTGRQACDCLDKIYGAGNG